MKKDTVNRLHILLAFPLWGARRPLFLQMRSGRPFILTVVCVGVFVDSFTYSVVVPILPFSLVDRLHLSPEDVKRWVWTLMATYGAGYMATAMVCGVGCDHLRSRRMILVLGGVLLGGSTALVCTGTTLPALVLGRLLQGSAAAVTWVIGQALLLETMGEEAAGRAMGYVTAAYSLSMLVAPLLGGLVYPEAGSTAVYGMAFGLMAVDIALRTLFVEEGEKLRWPEGGGSAVPLPSQRPPGLTLVTDRGRRSSWHRLGLLLCSPRVWATILGLVVVCATLTAFDTTVPIFVKERFGWNSRDAGLVFLALLLPLVVGGPGVGILVDRYGARWFAAGGLALSVPWWVLLGRIDDATYAHKVAFCAYVTMLGVSSLFGMTALMAEMGRATEGSYILGFGISNVAVAIGATLGPSWSGVLQEQGRWSTLTWSFGVASAITVIPVVVFVDGFIGHAGSWSRGTTNAELIPDTPTSSNFGYGDEKGL